MSASVNGTKITLTKGDTLIINVSVKKNGEEYIPEQGDSIRFALKKSIIDAEPLIVKNVDLSNMTLMITAEESKELAVGGYKYDLELTTKDGYVDTFIGPATFLITEEVY